MKRLFMAAFVAATLCVGNAFAQPAAVKKIIETAKADNQTMHHLDILSNRFGGRLIGSDAYENAAEWMLREFKVRRMPLTAGLATYSSRQNDTLPSIHTSDSS